MDEVIQKLERILAKYHFSEEEKTLLGKLLSLAYDYAFALACWGASSQFALSIERDLAAELSATTQSVRDAFTELTV